MSWRRRLAPITHAARLSAWLVKVRGKNGLPAQLGLSISKHGMELSLGAHFTGRHGTHATHICCCAVQQHTIRRRTIAPSAPSFLVIALEGLGYARMHNKAHIAFVDAHAKGNGSTHDLDGACAPLRMNAMLLCFI